MIFICFLFIGNPLLSQNEQDYDLIQANLEAARDQDDYKRLANAYFQRAEYYFGEDFKSEQVLKDLQQSVVYYRYEKDSLGVSMAKMNMARLYIRSKSFYEDAIEFLNESGNYFKKNNHKREYGNSRTLLSKVYEARQDYEKAEAVINEAININLEINDKNLEIENGLIRAQISASQGLYKQASRMAQKLLGKSQKLKDKNLIVKSLTSYGNFQIGAGEYEEAIVALTEAEKKVVKGTPLQADIYQFLAKAFTRSFNYKVGYAYQSRYVELTKELMEKEKSDVFSKLSVEYQTVEKEKEIKELEIEKDDSEEKLVAQQRLNLTLGFAFIAGITALSFILLFYRQKIKVNTILAGQQDELNKREIKKLEDELKIQNLESMVQGQEQERKRIATDLHDSLGGTLSTLKLQFDNYNSEKEETERGGVIHKLIDEACVEVRKIARNLKPSAIENVGLEAAIIDLINKYKNTKIEINFHSDSEDHVLTYESKLHLYRIVQELLNNTIKHAGAQEVTIQLYTQDDEIILMVEDDGEGFDMDIVEKGLGLDNIKSRINMLKGDISIDSSKNRGTSVVIHVPISSNVDSE